MGIIDFLARPLGILMHFIYYNLSFDNYGLAIIIFTILTRLIIFPLNLKQYKNSARMQQLNPKLDELRRKYGNDKERLNEETMKLYQEEKISPLSGCLPMLIQFPIILALYRIISGPLTYMLQKTSAQIAELTDIYRQLGGEGTTNLEIKILNFFRLNPDHFSEASHILSKADLLNMRFLGLNLGETPTFSPSILFGSEWTTYLPLLLIPIVGVVVSYIASRVSMMNAQPQAQQNQQAASMNKTMLIVGPAMTLIFSFQLPAGVLVYWIAGYFIQIIQQLYVNKYILKTNASKKEQPKGLSDEKLRGVLEEKPQEVLEEEPSDASDGLSQYPSHTNPQGKSQTMPQGNQKGNPKGKSQGKKLGKRQELSQRIPQDNRLNNLHETQQGNSHGKPYEMIGKKDIGTKGINQGKKQAAKQEVHDDHQKKNNLSGQTEISNSIEKNGTVQGKVVGRLSEIRDSSSQKTIDDALNPVGNNSYSDLKTGSYKDFGSKKKERKL